MGQELGKEKEQEHGEATIKNITFAKEFKGVESARVIALLGQLLINYFVFLLSSESSPGQVIQQYRALINNFVELPQQEQEDIIKDALRLTNILNDENKLKDIFYFAKDDRGVSYRVRDIKSIDIDTIYYICEGVFFNLLAKKYLAYNSAKKV